MSGIRIDRVVTRGGDSGKTSLGNGARVSKACPRIEAMGSVDELNAFLGALRHDMEQDARMRRLIPEIARLQSCLFDLGADLCMPIEDRPLSLTNAALLWLETCIEALRESQPALESFVLPGGTRVAAQAHILRTICRRAERRIAAIPDSPVQALRFLNRLSDYFFVLARHANNDGNDDLTWSPGQWQV